MARHSICLIHGHDAALLFQGIALSCSQHKHIDLSAAQLMVSGARARPWLDPDHNPRKGLKQPISESFRPTAKWAVIPHPACNGTGCRNCANTGTMACVKYLVILSARDWHVMAGCMQYVPLGSTRQALKRTHTHLKPVHAEKRGPVRVIIESFLAVS